MKDDTTGVAVEGFVGLKLKMYSFLVDDSSEHKKPKSLKNVATISHNEYKDNKLIINVCYIRRIESKLIFSSVFTFVASRLKSEQKEKEK